MSDFWTLPKGFSFKNTKIAKKPFEDLPVLADRARVILEKRTNKEIKSLIHTINKTVQLYCNDNKTKSNFNKHYYFDNSNDDYIKLVSRNGSLFGDVQEHECSAAFALWLVSKIVSHNKNDRMTINWLVQCVMEICNAERLYNDYLILEIKDNMDRTAKEAYARNALYMNAKKKADKSHIRDKKLKSIAIEHYKNNKSDYLSVQDAARRMAEAVVFAEVETIAKWLYEHNKKPKKFDINRWKKQ